MLINVVKSADTDTNVYGRFLTCRIVTFLIIAPYKYSYLLIYLLVTWTHAHEKCRETQCTLDRVEEKDMYFDQSKQRHMLLVSHQWKDFSNLTWTRLRTMRSTIYFSESVSADLRNWFPHWVPMLPMSDIHIGRSLQRNKTRCAQRVQTPPRPLQFRPLLSDIISHKMTYLLMLRKVKNWPQICIWIRINTKI